MSSAAPAAILPIAHPPSDLNQRDHNFQRYRPPPPYTQKPIFEGSYNDDDDDETASVHNLNPPVLIDSMGRENSDPIYEKNPPPPQYPQHPADPHHLQPGQHPSQIVAPYQPDPGAHAQPFNYIANQDGVNAKLHYDAYYSPQGTQATGQQHPAYPSPSFHDPRSAYAAYPPPHSTTIGQYVLPLPQLDFGHPLPIIVQPGLEDPPNDHMRYSIFVSVCCCWCVGFIAISKSIECRKAIAAGNGDLAKAKSFTARNTAHAALALGILMYLIAGAIIGFRIASAATRL